MTAEPRKVDTATMRLVKGFARELGFALVSTAA